MAPESFEVGWVEVVDTRDTSVRIKSLHHDCWIPRSQVVGEGFQVVGCRGVLEVTTWFAKTVGWVPGSKKKKYDATIKLNFVLERLNEFSVRWEHDVTALSEHSHECKLCAVVGLLRSLEE